MAHEGVETVILCHMGKRHQHIRHWWVAWTITSKTIAGRPFLRDLEDQQTSGWREREVTGCEDPLLS